MTHPQDTEGQTSTLESPETQTRFPPNYHVILLNDDYHSMGFVIVVLQKVLRCVLGKAMEIMLEAHNKGQAIIWTGNLEQAELKQEQVRSFKEADFGPLGCLIEPAP